jgi:hypothetical protein
MVDENLVLIDEITFFVDNNDGNITCLMGDEYVRVEFPVSPDNKLIWAINRRIPANCPGNLAGCFVNVPDMEIYDIKAEIIDLDKKDKKGYSDSFTFSLYFDRENGRFLLSLTYGKDDFKDITDIFFTKTEKELTFKEHGFFSSLSLKVKLKSNGIQFPNYFGIND